MFMTLTKARLIECLVAQRATVTRVEATEMVDLVFGIIKEQLVLGDAVRLSGFGAFSVADKRQRLGRNPATGDTIEIKARRVVGFKVSQVLKAEVNGGQDLAAADVED
jgi:integration host factor subunit alpha